jgi:hypothetical protein
VVVKLLQQLVRIEQGFRVLNGGLFQPFAQLFAWIGGR